MVPKPLYFGLAADSPYLDPRQASVYGKCIVADYNNVHKDKCISEFLRLKECYLVRRLFVLLFLLEDDSRCEADE